MSNFSWIGKGLRSYEFAEYVEAYEFGSLPPTFVVLHHTAVPGTRYANNGGWLWDANETGMAEDAIYANRLLKLANIRNFYESLGWKKGPHLFIDERWIWLFTPMYFQGIHAAGGNGNIHNGGKDYSIGIEVVGNYSEKRWPIAIETNVAAAVWALYCKLGTFKLEHGIGPGYISGHRDYNKPSCPGDAIEDAYYIGVIKEYAARKIAESEEPSGGHREDLLDPPVRYAVNAPTAVRQAPQPRGTAVVRKHPGDELVVGAIVDKGNGPWLWLADGSGFVPEKHASPLAGQHISEDTPILGESSVTPEQVTRYLLQRTTGEYTEHDIAYGIVPALFAWARRTSVNPLVMAAQMAHETDCLSSFWSQRTDKAGQNLRNPAGIGVVGAGPVSGRPGEAGWFFDGQWWRKGLGFDAWANPEVPGRTSIPAHAWRLHLYGGGTEHEEAQRWLGRPLPEQYWGCAPTVRGLGGTWMRDQDGHKAIVQHMRAILEC